jgi:UDP-2,3-diacylglucosamine hydrolase
MSRPASPRLAERPSSGAPEVPAAASPGRVGILAGGGRLPLTIAESVIERGGSVHIVAIEGEADPAIARFPHTWVNWGQVGRMVSTLRRHADAMVIAGGVRRPDLWKLRPDWGFFVSLPRILEMMAGGDDSVLSRVVRFFETKGVAVRGAHEVAPGLLALGGPSGALSLDRQGLADAELGFAVRAALGALDAGQAVVTEGGKVLAIEGAEGTDAMLRRVAALRGARAGASPSGVLAKGPKPGQELRVDMPTIGPRTVDLAAAAGLAGVAIEAGAVLLLDRAEAVTAADAHGIAIEGLAFVRSPARRLDLELEQGAGRRVPPTPGPKFLFRNAGVSVRRSHQLSAPGGELPPCSRAGADIEKGLAAIERLARFDTGKAAVVSRAYILSIAAADSVFDMLERTPALRQWGVGASRRVGVVVCRADAAKWDAESVAQLLDKAAAGGLECVAVTGPAAALAPFAEAGGLADRHDLVLVTREEHP